MIWKLHGDKDKDLQTFKTEISDLLKDEIVSRYYYQKGRIQANAQDDPEISKAIDILDNKPAYSEILHGSYQGETVFAVSTH